MIAQAVHDATRCPLDEHVHMFSWVDDTFFICKKSLARSVASHSNMAASATLNNVYGAYTGAVITVFLVLFGCDVFVFIE